MVLRDPSTVDIDPSTVDIHPLLTLFNTSHAANKVPKDDDFQTSSPAASN
jgi:hypothetical protein